MEHDDTGQFWGVLAGSGVFIVQICVLVPGLLACLLLAGALALPLLLPLIPIALLVGLFYLVRGVGRAAIRGAGRVRRLGRRVEAQPRIPLQVERPAHSE
jgi:hypothetical protein